MIPVPIKVLVILTILHSTSSSEPSKSCQIFGELAKENYFADKTDLLNAFLNHERHNEYINAPSGFGKTTSIHMLNCFLNLQLDENRKPVPVQQSHAHEIFKSLNISKNTSMVDRFMAQVPVINLNLSFSFQPTDNVTDETIISELNSKLKQTFSEYAWLPLTSYNESYVLFMGAALEGKLTKEQILVSIKTLSEILQAHFSRRPILLVDEYDTLFHYLIQFGDQVQLGYDLINIMLELAIDQFLPNSVDYTFMVGISSSPLFSAGNLLLHVFHEEFTIAHRFHTFYGFTNAEMKSLFEKYQCGDDEMENITRNYGSYVIRDDNLYITNSIAQYFKNRNPADTSDKFYWKPTTAINLLFFFYDVPSFTKRVFNLLAGETIKLTIDTSLVYFNHLRHLASNITNATDESDDHILHPFLLEQGYAARTGERDMYVLPNLEAYHSLNNNLLKYYNKQMNDTQHLRKYIPKI